MKPIYIPKYIYCHSKLISPEDYHNLFWSELINLNWLEATPARKEYFMADNKLSYTYGSGNSARTYESSGYSEYVEYIRNILNADRKHNYNVCFLNRYDTQKQALNWHADDSSEMNAEHDICVVSFGAEREIWWKEKDFKGEIPKENRQLLESGSLFIMPAGFQEKYFHKIPKCDRVCGIRISLTFRNYIPII